MSTAFFYSVSTACTYLKLIVCPLSFSNSHCTVCWFYVTMSTAVFYILSTACQYLTVYRLLVLCL